MFCGFGGEGVPVAAFVDPGVCALPSGWVESFEEFTDRPVALLFECSGGKIPPGR